MSFALAVKTLKGPQPFSARGRRRTAPDAHQRKGPAELVNRCNAIVAGVARPGKATGLPSIISTRGRHVNTGENFDHSRFARTIVAQKAQDFTRSNF